MKHILITNDDGFDALGLEALIRALRPLAHLTIVAPASQKSACGHSLTLTKPLRFLKVEDDFYKLEDGTPTDCVFLSLSTLFNDDFKPDLIVSGINLGANMGEDITYSGTASAAMEAVLHDIPAIAISQVCKDRCADIISVNHFELASYAIATIVEKIFDSNFPLGKRKFLNVNVPPIAKKDCKGFKITKAGYRLYGNDVATNRDPRGQEYHWIGLHPLIWEKEDGVACDFEAIKDGFISITPVKLDMTSMDDLKILEEWL